MDIQEFINSEENQALLKRLINDPLRLILLCGGMPYRKSDTNL